MPSKTICTFSILVLSACGGSNGSVASLSQSGFAKESDTFSQSFQFTANEQFRILSDEDGNGTLAKQTVELRGIGDTFSSVVIDGVEYELTEEVGDPGDFIFEGSNARISVESFLREDSVQGVEVFSVVDDELNRGLLAVGYDTDPNTISELPGDATYTGDLIGTLVNGFDNSFSVGDFILNVSFNDAEIGGFATIIDPKFAASDFEFEDVEILLERTSIKGNRFTGAISVIDGEINGTLEDANYQGRFFDEDGSEIGGQMSGRIDIDGLETDTFVEAIFIGASDNP